MPERSAQERYDTITAYLERQYGPVFSRGEQKFPVQVLKPTPEQRDDVDSVLGAPPTAHITRDDLAFYDLGHLHTIQNSSRHLFNGTTFAFRRLQRRPALKLEAAFGTYFDMLATCGALEQELRDSADSNMIRLPGRIQVHHQVQPRLALTQGKGRSAALGGLALIVFNRAGEYHAILARRSGRSATDPGFFHLLPAFIFQPHNADMQPYEWSLRYHIEREYLEELFGLPEAVGTPPEALAQEPPLVYLHELMTRGEASLHFTGMAFNLLTLRHEFCTLLLIRSPKWWEKVSTPGGPLSLDTLSETDDGRLHLLPIVRDEAVLGALPPEVHTIMPPQAVAGLWLGIDLARELLGMG